MARVQIPVTLIVRAGIAVGSWTLLDPANGNYFLQPDGGVELEFVNLDGVDRTITMISSLTVDDLAVDDLPIPIPAGGSVISGGFRRKTFNQEFVDGSVYVDTPVGANVLARAYRFVDAG